MRTQDKRRSFQPLKSAAVKGRLALYAQEKAYQVI